MSRANLKGVLCILLLAGLGNWVKACRPKGTPTVQEMGCAKTRGGDSGKILEAVEKGDPKCIYKDVWTQSSTVEHAPDYKTGDYAKVFGYEEPSVNDVTFEGCSTATPNAPNYAITQWFCLDWCQKNCVNMQLRREDDNTAFPFKKIKCEPTAAMNCQDPVKCFCTDDKESVCSTDSKKAKPTVGDMIDTYNSSCLNCYYNRPAKCTWSEVVGSGKSDAAAKTPSKPSSSSSIAKKSSSTSTSVDKSSSSTLVKKASKKTTQDSSDSQDSSSSSSSTAEEIIEEEQKGPDVTSANTKQAVKLWAHKNVDQNEEPPTQLQKRVNPAIISVPEAEATDEEKTKAKDPEMEAAVKDANKRLAKRLARKAARKKFLQDLLDALKQFKDDKRAKFEEAIKKWKALKKARKGLKGKARKENKKAIKAVFKDLNEQMKELKGEKKEKIDGAIKEKKSALKAVAKE